MVGILLRVSVIGLALLVTAGIAVENRLLHLELARLSAEAGRGECRYDRVAPPPSEAIPTTSEVVRPPSPGAGIRGRQTPAGRPAPTTPRVVSPLRTKR